MSKEEKMFAVVRRWESSGQSKAEFSRDNDIAINTFHYWFRRYRDVAEAAPAFVQLTDDRVAPEPAREPRIRLELPDGTALLVY